MIDAAVIVRMVGEPGFEPGTSCTQNRRATRLRYTPSSDTRVKKTDRVIGCGRGGGSRTPMSSRTLDFESSASTTSATHPEKERSKKKWCG